MGMTNNEFKVHIRFLLRDLEQVKDEMNIEKKNEILDKIIGDLQVALED